MGTERGLGWLFLLESIPKSEHPHFSSFSKSFIPKSMVHQKSKKSVSLKKNCILYADALLNKITPIIVELLYLSKYSSRSHLVKIPVFFSSSRKTK